MTDENQTPAAAAAAPTTATPEADDGIVVTSGGADSENAPPSDVLDPQPAPAPEEDDEPKVPLAAMVERVDRTKRQRDAAREEAYLRAGQLDELREVTRKLRALDPEKFPTHEAYEAAKKDLNEKAEKLTAPEPAPDPRQAALQQAATDLRYEVSRDDPDLWAQVVAVEEVDGQKLPKVNNLTAEMIEALADADDSTGKLRALVAMSDEDRLEIAELSPRMQRKAIMRLAPVAKGKAPPAAATQPTRDPETGQFRRQSAAPAPINPISGGPAGNRPPATTDEFIAQRNAAQGVKNDFWL